MVSCRYRTGHALAEQLFWISRNSVCCKKTLRWSRGETKARLLGPQNAHDSRSGMVAPHARAAHARGVHRKRFNVWRWEASLESFYGRAFREPPRRGHQCRVGYGMLKIAKRGKATNGCSIECNDSGRCGFPLLPLWCSSANFGRVHSLLPSFRCSNLRNLFLETLVVAWMPSTAVLGGLQIRGWSLLYTRAFSCCSLKTAPSSRGEDPEDFDGCSFVNCCSLKTAPSSRGEGPVEFDGYSYISCHSLVIGSIAHELTPFVCLVLACLLVSRSAVSQVFLAEFHAMLYIFFGQVQAASS